MSVGFNNPPSSGAAGSGDVVGPVSSGDAKVVLFDGVTGKLLKDSGLTLTGSNTGDQTLAGLGGVPNTRTVAGHALSADVTVSQSDVGLSNVDNTSDSSKPVSTAQQTALDLKANLASPTFTGTVAGITAAMVGLGNVTNTSDANKPVSTAQQTALDLKANLASPTFTGTVVLPAGTVTLAMEADMATSSLVYRKTAGSGAPEVNTLATVKTDLGLTGTNSGDQTITLTGNVTGSGTNSFAATIANGVVTEAMQVLADNTTANVSTTAHGYAPKVTDTTKFLKGDGTWATVTATAPDIALSLLAPTSSETITAGNSAVVVRSYAVASGQKLTIELASRMRLL